MGLRDIFLIVFIYGAVPFAIARPWIGVLVFTWVSLMNPHRLAWGAAHDMPFAQVMAVATIGGLLFDKGDKSVPFNALTAWWALFTIHISITTVFALNPDDAFEQWQFVIKIQVMTLVAMMLMKSRQKLDLLIGVIVGSIGFYGIKGGFFALITGMNYRVWGPRGFIEGNNELALALIICLPLFRYLQITASRKWFRIALAVSMGLICCSIISSYSRGAFLAGSVMGMVLLWESRKRGMILLGILLVIPVALFFAPEIWIDRMSTISNYEQDESAMGRINAWGFAVNLALDRPFVGGGFETFTAELFEKYAPDPVDFHDSHSIYFGILGQHGFVGLAIFLMLGLVAYFTNGRVKKQTKNIAELRWAYDLAGMLRVSFVGYAAGGAFLGLQYYDLPYMLLAITVLLKSLVEQEISLQHSPASMDSPGGTDREDATAS